MTEAEAILIIGISALALWQKHIILYIGTFVGLLLYGYSFAETSWTPAVPILALAGFMLYKSIVWWWR